MRVLEQRITESREASVANASVAEMQQVQSLSWITTLGLSYFFVDLNRI